MVRYNNKHEKKERKKLQNKNKKAEIHSGKVEFNADPWETDEYKNISWEKQALLMKTTADHSWKTFYLYDQNNWEKFEAQFTKKLPKELSKFLVVGDILYYQKESDKVEIIWRKPRKNKLSRIKWDANRTSLWEKKEQIFAVNIDLWIIVVSATQPKFNPWMIERYLLLFEYHGIRPILCITKTDLHDLDPSEYEIFAQLGLPIFFITDSQDDELMRLKEFITNNTVVFVWNSWVGKTSLTNKVYGQEIWKEGNTSEKTWYGMHTTRSSTVYEWKQNSFVIDTPGIMNLNLFEVNKQNLKYLFRDFLELNNFCKYKKCTHTIEPDCAVIQAYEDEFLIPARFELYQSLMKKLDN